MKQFNLSMKESFVDTTFKVLHIINYENAQKGLPPYPSPPGAPQAYIDYKKSTPESEQIADSVSFERDISTPIQQANETPSKIPIDDQTSQMNDGLQYVIIQQQDPPSLEDCINPSTSQVRTAK